MEDMCVGHEETEGIRAFVSMGNWAEQVWYWLQAMNSNKGVGTSWFHCWKFWSGRARGCTTRGDLGAVYWWLIDKNRGQCGMCHCAAKRRTSHIWPCAVLPNHEQWGRIRIPYYQATNRLGHRSAETRHQVWFSTSRRTSSRRVWG